MALKRLAYKSFWNNVLHKRDSRVMNHRAKEIRTKFLKHRTIVGLKIFAKMQVKKLESIRTVEQYLHEKRTNRVLEGLRKQLQRSKTMASLNREACKFRLFRYTYFLKKVCFRGLRQPIILREEKKRIEAEEKA